MKLQKKIIGLHDNIILNCSDYSKIIDISVYKGGYDEYYCKIYYTSPDNSESENKKIHILCVSDVRENPNNPTNIDDKYTFLKSIEVKNNISYHLFFFIYEELSVVESRDNKIKSVIEFPQ